MHYQNIDYTLDAVGNVENYTNNAYDYQTSQTYKYDDLYQLTKATGDSKGSAGTISGLPQLYTSAYSQEFVFDSIGNMKSKTSSSQNPGDNLTYQYHYDYYEGTHKARRIGNWYYHYDGNGNLLTENYGSPLVVNADNAHVNMEDGVYSTDYGFAYTDRSGSQGANAIERRDYEWNERNLLSRSINRNYQADYRYGADGQRAIKYSVRGTIESETMYFNKMFQRSVIQGYMTESKHIYVGETRIVTKQKDERNEQTLQEGVQMYFYHGDHLGSAQLVTNVVGEIYEHLEYTPYGELWVDHAVSAVGMNPTAFRFTGKEQDVETGLYYYGARYLDPKTSRWISADPAMGEYIPMAPVNDQARKHNKNLPGLGGIFNLVNFHTYHYAGNNPVIITDTDGRQDGVTIYNDPYPPTSETAVSHFELSIIWRAFREKYDADRGLRNKISKVNTVTALGQSLFSRLAKEICSFVGPIGIATSLILDFAPDNMKKREADFFYFMNDYELDRGGDRTSIKDITMTVQRSTKIIKESAYPIHGGISGHMPARQYRETTTTITYSYTLRNGEKRIFEYETKIKREPLQLYLPNR